MRRRHATGNKLPDPIINHGDYVFDQCHGHYHFEHYGTFSYVDDRGQDVAGDQQKRGFCLIDLVRVVNAEWSPLTPHLRGAPCCNGCVGTSSVPAAWAIS